MKRVFDFLGAAAGSVVLAPLFLAIAVAVVLETGRPVLFRQERVGLHGRTFRIFKFRTMVAGAEAGGQLTVAGDARVTRVGRFLRKHKLDELPQLWNVILGHMSLVGPRPEVPRYVSKYSEADRRIVLSVRPGITDNASIEFRNENDLLQAAEDPDEAYVRDILPRKLALYRQYVTNRSLFTDFRIILKTLRTLGQ